MARTLTARRGVVLAVAAGMVLTAGAAHAQDPCGVDVPPLPAITLSPGEFYARVDGTATVLPGTNPWAPTAAEFAPLLAGAGVNDKIVRLFVHSLRQTSTSLGEFTHAIDTAWASEWDTVLCDARANGLYVLLVLDVWPNWNDVAKPDLWAKSIYNVASTDPGCVSGAITCGTATDPSEILQPGATQTDWLNWISDVVSRLKSHTNIFGYEIFSEINNIVNANDTAANQVPAYCAATGGTQLPPAVCLMEAAAATIRAVDPGRPLTASVTGVNDWPSLSTSSLDILQMHPYADVAPIDGGNLDVAILDHVRLRRAYGKPVFIGESGLDQLFPDVTALTVNPRGWVGVNHAVWAGAVAGSMNARMLWYEDGYDNDAYGRINLCTLTGLNTYLSHQTCLDGGILTLSAVYQNASQPVTNFLANVDYAGFEPVTLTSVSGNLIGAALGTGTEVIGWVRDTLSAHNPAAADPYWPARSLNGEMVTVAVTGQSDDWVVDFYDTLNGNLISSIDADQDGGGQLTFTLPLFEDGSIAFQIHAVSALDVTIDIRPLRRVNLIVPGARKPFPVAILPSEGFDPANVDVSTIRFGPAGAEPIANQLNPDGDAVNDLMLLFRPRHTGLACGDIEATLTGETLTGRSFTGTDSVRIIGIGCPP